MCLKSGIPYTIQAGDASLVVLGLRRIGAPVGETGAAKPKYVQEYELERIYGLDMSGFDVLLTHDVAPGGIAGPTGLAEVRLVLDTYKPSYHFYGHTEEPYQNRLE